MPYKKRGKRTKLLDLARKSRERAQARRKAEESRVGGKRYVTPLPKAKSKAKPEAKAKVTRHGDTTITYKPKPSPHLRTAPKKPTHGRVIPKNVTGRTAKPSMVKPPTGKKVKPVQRPKPSNVSSWQKLGEQRGKTREERRKQTIRASRRTTGGGVPRGRKGFLGIPGLTADKYKQAQLRAKGKRLSGDLAMKIPGSMSTKTAGRIGTGLEIGGSVLMLLTPAAPIAVANFKRYAATTAGKEFLKRGGTIKKWFSTAFKGKKNPFKDLSGSKGRQGYKEPIGPSPKPAAKKSPAKKKKAAKKSEPFKVGGRTGTERPFPGSATKTAKKTPAKTPPKKTAKKPTDKKPVVKKSSTNPYTEQLIKETKADMRKFGLKAPAKKAAKKKAAKKKAAKKAVTTGRKKGGRRMMDKKRKK